jgi:hypothetical protein
MKHSRKTILSRYERMMAKASAGFPHPTGAALRVYRRVCAYAVKHGIQLSEFAR